MQWDATLTFTLAGNDITAYVRSWDVQRGRANNAQPVQPGVAVLTLDNTDRRFEPGYTSGAYYPDIAPHATLSIKATHSATDYWLFHGYVEAFPVQWSVDGDTDSIVQIRAFDYLSIMHRDHTPFTYTDRVLRSAPQLFFPMDEDEGSSVSDHRGNIAGEFIEGNGGTMFHLLSSSPLDYDHRGIDFTESLVNFGPVRQLHNTGNQSYEFWADGGNAIVATYGNTKVDGSFQGDTQFYIGFENLSGFGEYGTEKYLFFAWHPGVDARGGTGSTGGPENNPEDADVFFVGDLGGSIPAGATHYAITRNVTTRTVRMYRDGVELPVTQHGEWVDPPEWGKEYDDPEYWFALGDYGYGDDPFTPRNGHDISHFAIYDRLLRPREIAFHANASLDRWANQTPGARIDDILDVAGWATGVTNRDIDTGGTPNLDDGLVDSSLSLLQQAQRVAVTADGVFYHAPNGYSGSDDDVMAFQGRDNRYNATAASTWKDGTPNNRYHSLTFGVNDAVLFNDVMLDDGKSAGKAVDASSVSSYGRRTLSLTTVPADSVTHLDDLADWLVARHKDPNNTFLTMTVKPQRSDVTWADALSLDVSDMLRIIRTPVGGGTALDLNCFVESVRHSGNARGEWLITVTLTLADLYEVFEVADVTYGQLGAYPLAL